MVKTCYGCGRTVEDNPRYFGLRVAALIKPRVGRTRYYCEQCWALRVEEANHGAKNQRDKKTAYKGI